MKAVGSSLACRAAFWVCVGDVTVPSAQAALVCMLYDKMLKLSSAVKGEMGVGAIVNLQSNDAAKIWALPQYMHVLWSGPFQVRGLHTKCMLSIPLNEQWDIVATETWMVIKSRCMRIIIMTRRCKKGVNVAIKCGRNSENLLITNH